MMPTIHTTLNKTKWTISKDEYCCFNNFINTYRGNQNILRKILTKYAYIPAYIDVYKNIKQYDPKGIGFEMDCLILFGKILPVEGKIISTIKKIIADNNLHMFNNVYVDKEKTITYREVIDKTDFNNILKMSFLMTNLKFLDNNIIEGLVLFNTEIIEMKIKLYPDNAVLLIDNGITWIHKTLIFLIARRASYNEFYEIKIDQCEFLYEGLDSPTVLFDHRVNGY